MGVTSARLSDTTLQCGLEFNSVPAAADTSPASETLSIRAGGRAKDKVVVFFRLLDVTRRSTCSYAGQAKSSPFPEQQPCSPYRLAARQLSLKKTNELNE